ncbi:MAG: aromatic amino acid lyase [Gammaproteobacteria bacterium]|nr:aromatic amino acid lyase [Gammaproteobacteria bacterium]NIR85946.1 aromatic amino acid lyase [Gammaproteobacteria bacterium]NIR91938.1 aromatic amino acid lyase [Gammaproteobacteria bacterium]NIU07195.1 aromatic amino acid lyase [Gammaproteobacteria bacterium]NIV54008.1 aromatic amino acid lyase [Gammaproteobacteria bacterium]
MTLVVRSRADLTLDAFQRVAWHSEPVILHADAMARMREARATFERLLDDPDAYIYGVSSGYGQRASVRLSPEERREQAARPSHVVRTSFGEPLPERITRGTVLARLANFVEGHAAVSPRIAEGVAAMLGGARLPPVPALGNGCPGEIQALSHLFIDLQQRITLREKDALALVNGSPCASALVADAALAARHRWGTATEVFALAWEAMSAPLDHLDPALDGLWEDPYEARTLAHLRDLVEGAPGGRRRRYQAPVSWRIVPRVLGQALRAAAQAEEVAAISLRAVSDNPVFLPPDTEHPHGRAISTGGFHNARAYPALDNLAAVWADVSLLCDRQLTKLLDGRVSELPDQLVTGPGVYLGCLGFAAAGYAEHARHAAQRTFLPGSEGGGFGQNDVSVPTFVAWRKAAEAGRCLDAALALLALVASQAFFATERAPPRRLRTLLKAVRAIAPPMTEPRALGPEAESLQRYLTARAFEGCTVEDSPRCT